MISKVFFPVECLEDIFRHLQGRDLIKCTEVVPEWNDLIGSTRWCMQNIKLKFYCWRDYSVVKDEEIIYKIFETTKRKYECVSLMGEFSDSIARLLSVNKGQWRQVLSNLHFVNAVHYLEFLSIIEPSVEKLEFAHGIHKNQGSVFFDSSNFKFP